MIYLSISLSIFFVIIGFTITESNAKYLLAGYNTMSDAERQNVDIEAYVSQFRKFHIFLGISFLILALILGWIFGENAVGIFAAAYPILAYTYFIIDSSKHLKGPAKNSNKLAVLILLGTLVVVIGLFFYGFRESEITFDSQGIEIKGAYGEKISSSEIRSIELMENLPKIAMKINGFAMGEIRKGKFSTKEGKSVKLILNSSSQPLILITKVNDQRLYYSVKAQGENERLFQQLKAVFPQTNY